MNFQNSLNKLKSSSLVAYPFDHLVIENFLESPTLNDLFQDLARVEKSTPDKLFDCPHGKKREWRSFTESSTPLHEWMSFLSSPDFIDALREIFSIPPEIEIFPDQTYDGGGYVISPPKAFLSYHADFNFSSNVDKYRSLNVLFYMNQDYDEGSGGHLHLLDSDSKTVEAKVLPKANTLLAFRTDDHSIHGVSRNGDNFNRRSFNIYYYTNKPISINQSETPHKTLWLEVDSHDH
ncbi:Oxoglutarate/iron-dependent dioxygenase [Candidatus Nanopelagicaceae bacterium]